MQQAQKVVCLLFAMVLSGSIRVSGQETDTTQEETLRKLQTRMDDLRAEMAKIQTELDAIHGQKLPRTGSIVSTPPPHST